MLWGSHSAYAKCSNNLRVEELQGRAVQNHQELRLGQDFLSLLSWLKQPGASPTQELKQEADLNDVSLLCYAAAFTWLRLLMSNNAVDKCGIQDYSKKIYIFFFCTATGLAYLEQKPAVMTTYCLSFIQTTAVFSSGLSRLQLIWTRMYEKPFRRMKLGSLALKYLQRCCGA